MLIALCLNILENVIIPCLKQFKAIHSCKIPYYAFIEELKQNTTALNDLYKKGDLNLKRFDDTWQCFHLIGWSISSK